MFNHAIKVHLVAKQDGTGWNVHSQGSKRTFHGDTIGQAEKLAKDHFNKLHPNVRISFSTAVAD